MQTTTGFRTLIADNTEWMKIIEKQSDFSMLGDLHERLAFERLLSRSVPQGGAKTMIGYCEVCGAATEFVMDWQHSDNVAVNFRERLGCRQCQFNSRMRFMLGLLKKLFKVCPVHDVYMYEMVTPFFRACRHLFPTVNWVGSEYLGATHTSGQLINGIRHEDALNLSFGSKTHDLLISCDVYEHVPDVLRALKEACRVLRDGGTLLFSVPMNLGSKDSTQRAVVQNGRIVHLLPEAYHGNPLSAQGSLVFTDFGWDLLEMCKAAGFHRAYMIAYYSVFYGYLGCGLQYVLVAESKEEAEKQTSSR